MEEPAHRRATLHAVTARRRKKSWILGISVEGSTIELRCKRLDQATDLARTAIAKRMHVDERSLSIELYIDVGLELQDQINRTREAFKQSAEARAQASLLGHGTAALLAKQGLQKRDIGVLLGVSPGKAAKLLDTYHGGSAD